MSPTLPRSRGMEDVHNNSHSLPLIFVVQRCAPLRDLWQRDPKRRGASRAMQKGYLAPQPIVALPPFLPSPWFDVGALLLPWLARGERCVSLMSRPPHLQLLRALCDSDQLSAIFFRWCSPFFSISQDMCGMSATNNHDSHLNTAFRTPYGVASSVREALAQEN